MFSRVLTTLLQQMKFSFNNYLDRCDQIWRSHTLTKYEVFHYRFLQQMWQNPQFPAVSCGFGHIYWRNLQWKLHFCAVTDLLTSYNSSNNLYSSKHIIQCVTIWHQYLSSSNRPTLNFWIKSLDINLLNRQPLIY